LAPIWRVPARDEVDDEVFGRIADRTWCSATPHGFQYTHSAEGWNIPFGQYVGLGRNATSTGLVWMLSS
jgi:hypothetical protein